ncbi:hypothetical protein [Streptomyces sp. NPDC005125]
MATGYTYAASEITAALAKLGQGTEEIRQIVVALKTNVDLNFEDWVGKSKEEFVRVHGEATTDIYHIGEWLKQTMGTVSEVLDSVLDDDEEYSSRLEVG